MSNSEVRETLSPILGLVETRLSLLAPLSRLRGRLDLLVDQIQESSKRNADGDLGESLLVYQDQGTKYLDICKCRVGLYNEWKGIDQKINSR